MNKLYRYGTNDDQGTIEAESLEAAYEKLRGNITASQKENGATLWVQDEDGKRITMGDEEE